MTGRRVGWASRRSLKVIDAKAPGFDNADSYDVYDDACDGWHGCGVNGCCVNLDWAVEIMPPMLLAVDGLVHVTQPGNPTTACGEEGNWPVPELGSTDEAIAYARTYRGDFREVTCFSCIAWAVQLKISWKAT